MNTLAERIRYLLNSKNVTPYEVEHKTVVTQATISRVINGVTKKLNITNTEILAEYFGVTPEWLKNGENSNTLNQSNMSVKRKE